MTWLVLLIVAVGLIWLLSDQMQVRLIAAGAVAAILVVAFFAFQFLSGQNSPPPPIDRPALERKREAALRALKPSDIALLTRQLVPQKTAIWKADGTRVEQDDLFNWTLTADVRNAGANTDIGEIYLQVWLYSCPSFFDTPQADADGELLDRSCSAIGRRTVGFHDLHLAQGADTALSQPVTFDSQPQPRNWRFRIEVDRVVAAVSE